MKTVGIIAEYNPFHNGHAYQISKTRALGATHIVACMSGNFVQRGECAMFSKFARTKAALLGGVDLVIELPLPYAVSSAERFAFGAVSLLNALGCVDLLSFGSECGDADLLKKAAQAVESPELKPALDRFLAEGRVFPKARQLAAQELFGAEVGQVLTEPNNTLAVEYMKWLGRLDSRIEPMTITRKGAMHLSETASGSIASATMLRGLALTMDDGWQRCVPPEAAEIFKEETTRGGAPCTLTRLERSILAKLRGYCCEGFTAFPDVTEGLEGRIYKAVRGAAGLTELYSMIKSKRYTLSRIRRIVLCAYLGVTADLQRVNPPYIRVLGFNARGAELLTKAKASATLPIQTSMADIVRLGGDCACFGQLEASATDLFSLCSPQIFPCGLDFTTKPVIIR